MNLPLPAESKIPDPNHVRIELALAGYGHVAVFVHPDMGCMIEPEMVPDDVWLAVLAKAGASPLPCLPCYKAGDGVDCAGGRCRNPNAPTAAPERPRLTLPPGFRR